MASTARSLRYALAILTTSLVTPSVWAHAHLTHQYPAANAQVTAARKALKQDSVVQKSRGQKTKILKHYRRSGMSRTKSN